jgi:hypothetical protein
MSKIFITYITTFSPQESLFDRRTIHTPDSAVDIHYNTDTSVDDCHLCKAENTEYMIHVFLPKLQRHLNVKEILPYLTFIGIYIPSDFGLNISSVIEKNINIISDIEQNGGQE